ncbi:hypothetical protein ERO13_D13G223202v2 [Gossypium hirsutum]|nr:hypothetical protein ERO13_D13G223202v2 [Gossypium hirsutum]
MISDVFLDHSTYAEPPSRFEAGTPAIGEAIGLGQQLTTCLGLACRRFMTMRWSWPIIYMKNYVLFQIFGSMVQNLLMTFTVLLSVLSISRIFILQILQLSRPTAWSGYQIRSPLCSASPSPSRSQCKRTCKPPFLQYGRRCRQFHPIAQGYGQLL